MYIIHPQGHCLKSITYVIEDILGKNNVTFSNNIYEKGTWIFFIDDFISGWNLKVKSKEYIVVQTENLEASRFNIPEYHIFLSGAKEVWDYTKELKYRYSLIHQIEAENSKEIDVLFYGWVNDYRAEIIRKIRNIKVIDYNNPKWGKELWKDINNSKIILDIPFYKPANSNWVKLAPLLSNGHFTISEYVDIDTEFNLLDNQIIIKNHTEIVDTVNYYLKNDIERIKAKNKAFDWFRNQKSEIVK